MRKALRIIIIIIIIVIIIATIIIMIKIMITITTTRMLHPNLAAPSNPPAPHTLPPGDRAYTADASKA